MQEEYNKATSKVWSSGYLVKFFKFLDFQKLKAQVSVVGKMYCVCSLLANSHACLYKSLTSEFFNVEPPTLNWN